MPYFGFQPIPVPRIRRQPTYASEINPNNQAGDGQHPIRERHWLVSSAKGSTGETLSGKSVSYPLPFNPSHLTGELCCGTSSAPIKRGVLHETPPHRQYYLNFTAT
jgi:hypothetical protein